jgi:hypothetical protein
MGAPDSVRQRLASYDYTTVVRPFADARGALERARAMQLRPQPSYLLLPLMFLATAEQHGGITERHRAYLPWYMLMMEVCAIIDDTVDRTPLRSGRDSFPERYSDAAAAAFSTFLIS